MIDQAPELQLLYETAPVGLAFLSPDCRYLQINRHLTEICGISVADHIGRSVRDTVPQVADQVEHIVQTILRTGEASIAHEVNQPLAAIVANANAGLRWLAKGTPDLTEVRALLKHIVSDVHRAGKVIASFRSMFEKDRGETRPLTVNDLSEVLNLVNGELAGHQISLQKEMHDRLPKVMADRVQLQQVVLNLIMNAIEAKTAAAASHSR